MPARIFSGDGFADSPVRNRSSNTIFGWSTIRYRRRVAAAETRAARRVLAPSRPSSLVFARLAGSHRQRRIGRRSGRAYPGDRRRPCRLQGQPHATLQRVTVVIGGDALTLSIGVDFERLVVDTSRAEQIAHCVGALLG